MPRKQQYIPRKKKANKSKAVKAAASTVKKDINTIRDAVLPAQQIRTSVAATLNTNNAIAANATHLVLDMTNIASGDSINAKQYPVIMVKGISLKLSVLSGSTITKFIRLLLISPKSYYEGDMAAALTSLFSNNSWAAAGYDKLVTSLTYPVNREKFNVYLDKAIKIRPQADDAVTKRVYRKIEKRVEFDKTSSNQSLGNQIYALALLCEAKGAVDNSSVETMLWGTTYFRSAHTPYVKYSE